MHGTRCGGLLKLGVMALVALLAACISLVGRYDEITDRAVTDLQKRTASFLVKLRSSSGAGAAYEANRKFYEDAQGEVSALILRAEIIEQGLNYAPLTKNFGALQKQYETLAELHKTAPPPQAFRSAEAAFEQSFRAILVHLWYLKWNQAPPDTKDR